MLQSHAQNRWVFRRQRNAVNSGEYLWIEPLQFQTSASSFLTYVSFPLPEPMNVGYRKDALAMTTSETWQAVFKTQDGDYSQHISHCFRSWRQYPTGHWWSMDLGSQSFLTISVRIWGRGDCCGKLQSIYYKLTYAWFLKWDGCVLVICFCVTV